MPAVAKLRIVQGQSIDSQDWVFTLQNSDGSATNLTGTSVYMDVRDNAGNLVIHLGTDNGYLVVNATAGTITPAVPSSATINLTVGDYVYDLWVIYPGSPPPTKPEVGGPFSILKRVTQTI